MELSLGSHRIRALGISSVKLGPSKKFSEIYKKTFHTVFPVQCSSTFRGCTAIIFKPMEVSSSVRVLVINKFVISLVY